MPLVEGKSPEAFHENVSIEVHSGKKLDQALAIAYAKKREAEEKSK